MRLVFYFRIIVLMLSLFFFLFSYSGNACDQSSLQYCMINRLSGQESIYFRIIIYVPFYDRPNITYLKPLFERSVTSVFRFVPLENSKCFFVFFNDFISSKFGGLLKLLL